MIRIKDIADRAGVSPTTVSNVIHGKTGRVSKATVEKINRILKEMEYVPSISARMLANNSSGLIGVALGFMKKGNASSFEDPFVSAMAEYLFVPAHPGSSASGLLRHGVLFHPPSDAR